MHPVPTPIDYDFGTGEDKAVEDFLSDEFQQLWTGTGRNNKDVFQKIFRPVPNDDIKTWDDYVKYISPSAGISVSVPVVRCLSMCRLMPRRRVMCRIRT